MKLIPHAQGSPQWLATRARHFCSSEAPAMMGTAKSVTRNELLAVKATGTPSEISDWVQEHLFDKGHEVEIRARPLAEDIIGEELYPVTATDDEGYLLASFDGTTMDEGTLWECKQWNESKAEAVRAGQCPPEDYWQVVQQLAVSGAKRCLYMVTDGTPKRCVHVWVEPNEADRKKLLAGWRQFEADLHAFVPSEPVAEPVGKAPETLPSLHIEVTGMVTASNLEAFKKHALAVFGGINRSLATDQDFADAEKTVKWCSDVESRLAAAKEHALAQTASIDELFRTIDSISAEARRVRLELDKLVKARKEQIRRELVDGGRRALAEHVAALNKRLGRNFMPPQEADFAGAIKGKRTVESLRNAVDTTLAHAKIAANERADAIEMNLKALAVLGADESLVPDLPMLVLKSGDDFATTVKLRIAERQAKIDAERERIRQEEQTRIALAAKAEEEARERAERAEREAAEEFIPEPPAEARREWKEKEAKLAALAKLPDPLPVRGPAGVSKRDLASNLLSAAKFALQVLSKPSTEAERRDAADVLRVAIALAEHESVEAT